MSQPDRQKTLAQGWFGVREVAPGIICFAEDEHVEEVRSYLVLGSERAMLWDAGIGIGNLREEVERFVPVRPDTLIVVSSHSHFDHVGDVWRFTEAGCDLYGHPLESARIAAGVPHEKIAHWLQPQFLVGALPEGFDPATYAIHPATVTHPLNDGDVIDLGDRQFVVLHMPGHSPGGIALWDAAHGVLLSGDTDYAGPLYAYSPDDADPDAYRRSVRRLAALAPDAHLVLPSHNGVPMDAALLVAIADAFDAIRDGTATDAYIARDDEAGTDHPYDLYDYGAFQVRIMPGWAGRK